MAVDVMKKQEEMRNKNTDKSNKIAVELFREYLTQVQAPSEFESFSEAQLDEHLAAFFLRVRTTDGELYKKNSLTNRRYALNRYLQNVCHKPFDILRSTTFRKSQEAFKVALTELKKEGKGVVKHYEQISDADLKKLYSSDKLNPNFGPEALLKKVMFDVRFYFCRRGCENMASMEKGHFTLSQDENANEYVYQTRDELTKNHRSSSNEHISGIMPAKHGDPLCPVASYKLYMNKLNPGLNRMWQRPRAKTQHHDTFWYERKPIGENSLSSFMKNLSAECELSAIYTNHSIRVTGITLLSRSSEFSAKQVMSVSGHKSLQSLSIYQRVSTDEKLKMGQTLSKSLEPETSSGYRKLLPKSQGSSSETSTAERLHLLAQGQVATDTEQAPEMLSNLSTNSDVQVQHPHPVAAKAPPPQIAVLPHQQMISTHQQPRLQLQQSQSLISEDFQIRGIGMPYFNNCSNISIHIHNNM